MLNEMVLVPSTQKKASFWWVFVVLTLCGRRESVLGTDLLMIHMNIAARESQILKNLPRDCTEEDEKTSTYFPTAFG